MEETSEKEFMMNWKKLGVPKKITDNKNENGGGMVDERFSIKK